MKKTFHTTTVQALLRQGPVVVSASALMVILGSTHAQTNTGATAASAPVAFQIGDRIILRSWTGEFKPVFQLPPSGASVPASSPFQAAQGDKKMAPLGTGLTVTKVSAEGVAVTVDSDPCPNWGIDIPNNVMSSVLTVQRPSVDACKESENYRVKEGFSYSVLPTALEKSGYNRYGFVSGVLAVPFKYFKHDKSFEPSQTIGPYVGYRFGSLGWGTSFILSSGLTILKSSKVVDDDKGNKVAKDVSLSGYSFATGVMFDLNNGAADPIRAGLVFGRDFVGAKPAVSYEHDGKTWVAAQIGFEKTWK